MSELTLIYIDRRTTITTTTALEKTTLLIWKSRHLRTAMPHPSSISYLALLSLVSSHSPAPFVPTLLSYYSPSSMPLQPRSRHHSRPISQVFSSTICFFLFSSFLALYYFATSISVSRHVRSSPLVVHRESSSISPFFPRSRGRLAFSDSASPFERRSIVCSSYRVK
jgi:hypothetical protein